MAVNGGLSSGSVLGDAPLFPWEQGILRHIFCDEPIESQALPAPVPVGSDPQPAPQEPKIKLHEPPVLPPGNSIFSKTFRNLSDKAYLEKRAFEIDKAFAKWDIICRRFHSADSAEVTQDHVNSLRASFGTKAPGTMLKRANALLGFIRWSDSIGCGVDSIFTEATLWRFLQHLQDEGKTSQGADVLSALRWAHFVLDFEGVADIISRRCVGSCEQMQSSKTFLQQADPLLVAEVQSLHSFTKEDEVQAMDKALGFFCLVCLYARCRVSDLDCVHDATWDTDEDGSGYLVLRVGWHKTSNLAQKRRVLLPLIIPLVGVDGVPFGNELWQVFESIGIRIEELSDEPFLRPFNRGGDLARRPVTTGEVSAFLQFCLSSRGFAIGDRKITSHSLKHTGLSWVGKYGMTKEDQCILGHHSDSVRGTEAVYSYDLSIGSVQRFEVLLHYISSGEFVPDEPRSKFWKFPPAEPVFSNPEPVREPQTPKLPASTEPTNHVDEVDALTPPIRATSRSLSPDAQSGKLVSESGSDSQAEDSGSSSSQDSSSPRSLGSREKKKARISASVRKAIKSPDGWVVHLKSKMLHLKYGDRMLQCGRAVSSQFQCAADSDLDGPICSTCKRHL